MGVKTKDLTSPNLKRIEGSVVYPPVGSQEAPQTIIVKEKFQVPNPKSQSQPTMVEKAL